MIEEKISNLKGFTKVSAKKISNKMSKIQIFLKETKLEYKLSSVPIEKPTNSELQGKIYVFTGIRDKDLEQIIVSKGGKIGTTVTKNTFKLITTTMDTSSSKIKKAVDLNIPISIYPDY